MSISAWEDGRHIVNPDDSTLLRWTYEKHVETCPTCRAGHTWCDRGIRIHTAMLPDTSWIPNTEGA